MILRDECKKIGISVQDLAVECDTPMRTLQNWSKSHPKRLRAYLDAVRFRQSQTGDAHLQEPLL